MKIIDALNRYYICVKNGNKHLEIDDNGKFVVYIQLFDGARAIVETDNEDEAVAALVEEDE